MSSSTIRIKRGTAAQWTTQNPILLLGEPGFEKDTGKIKVGDGVSTWSALSYIGSGGGGGGGIAESFETVSSNLSDADATLSYTGDKLTSVVYSNGITKTLGYTGDNLTTVVLSGSTPSGINLTKTLTYAGDDLTGIAYS